MGTAKCAGKHSKSTQIDMVMLHVKRGEKDGFLFETTTTTEVDVVVNEVIETQNMRLKLNRLVSAAEGLAAHGPMKPPEQQGLDDDTPLLEDYDVTSGETAPRAQPERNQFYNQDPTERRTGNAPMPELAKVIVKTCDDAKALTSARQVEMKQTTALKPLLDAMNNI